MPEKGVGGPRGRAEGFQLLCQNVLVSLAAVFSVVTQRSSPLSGEERCVTTLKTAVRETKVVSVLR